MSRFSIDPDLKARILKISGIIVAFFAIYTLLSCTSYLFHWKADQSVLDSDAAVHAENLGGSAGSSWGAFLVCSCLGLGSFALVGLLFVGARWLFLRIRPVGLASTILLVISGAWLTSVILSMVGPLVGAEEAFGGGLGGRMGAVTVAFMERLMGTMGLVMVVSVLFIIWLLFVCAPFAKWFTTAFEKSEKEQDDPVETPEDEKEGDEEEAETEQEVEVIPDELETVDPSEPVPAESESDPAPSDLPSEETVEEHESEPESQKDNGVIIQDGSECVISPEDINPEDVQEVKIVEATEWPEEVKELERIDNRDELKNFKFPPIDLLSDYADKVHKVTKAEIDTNNARIRTTLLSYKIQVDSVTAIVGPTVTLYKVKLAPGMKSSAVKSVEHDIAMALGNESVRVTYLSDAIGIEVANETKSMVPLKAMFNDPAFRESKFELPIALGYTIEQKVKTFDLADAPHLLVAGATKQGKSVGLNVIVASLLYSKHPSELKMVFVDPKRVEFTAYKRLYHHYLASLPQAASEQDEIDNVIIKDHKSADEVLKSLCIEMDQRYELLSDAGVNKLTDYNEKYKERHLRPDKGHRYLPYLVVVIDEYADLIMSAGSDAKAISKGVTTSIIRLAQKGRAAGIHVIIATQRPSVDVITGMIKTNFPSRIAFRTVTRVDSSTILDSPGAEKLIGKGDMLYFEGLKMERVQCAYLDMKEVNAITKFIGDQDGYKEHYNTPYYLPEVPVEGGDGEGGAAGMVDMHKLDANFEEAARLVVTYQKGSTSDIQRRLGMGYARAGKVMDQLEAAGIVGPQEGSKPRQVLVSDLAELDNILAAFLDK